MNKRKVHQYLESASQQLRFVKDKWSHSPTACIEPARKSIQNALWAVLEADEFDHCENPSLVETWGQVRSTGFEGDATRVEQALSAVEVDAQEVTSPQLSLRSALDSGIQAGRVLIEVHVDLAARGFFMPPAWDDLQKEQKSL